MTSRRGNARTASGSKAFDAKRRQRTITGVLALIDGPSQDRLEEFADEPIAGPLVILACPIPALAVSAAEALGRRMLGAEAMRSDMRRVAPETDRWLVADIGEVARLLALEPVRKHFLILERAEALEQRAYDRLLRILEEPPAPCLVVLTATDAGLLPATLRGRASAVISIIPAPPDEHYAALVSAGASNAGAREAVALAGSMTGLVLPLAMSAELRGIVRRLVATRFDNAGPVSDAVGRVGLAASASAAVEQAAGNPIASVASVRYDECSPAGKAQARDLLRLMAEHRRRTLTGQLGTAGGQGLASVQAALRALSEFEGRLVRAVPPGLCMTALVAELSGDRPWKR